MNEIIQHLINYESALLDFYKSLESEKLSTLLKILIKKETCILDLINQNKEALSEKLPSPKSPGLFSFLKDQLLQPTLPKEPTEAQIKNHLYQSEKSLMFTYLYLKEISPNKDLYDTLIIQRHISLKLIYNFLNRD